MTFQLGEKGRQLIQSFEGLYLYSYDDLGPVKNGKSVPWTGGKLKGTATIGWGHTDDALDPLKVVPNQTITQAQAESIFTNDMSQCVNDVNTHVKVALNQGQFDALVSFDYNCGLGNLLKLIAPLNAGNAAGTRAKFALYVKSKGTTLAGLVRRRAAEVALWDTGNYVAGVTPTQDTPKAPEAPVAPAPAATPTAAITAAGAAIGAGKCVSDSLGQVNGDLTTVQTFLSCLTAMGSNPWLWLAAGVVFGVVWLWYWHAHRTAA